MNDSLVDIQGVGFSYPESESPALAGIDLQIRRGEIFGLLGPNGAGKSTLLSILSGILPLQSGRITIDGINLRDNLAGVKRISAMVPQDYAFYTALTARENLEFFAGLLFDDAAQRALRVQDCIAACQLQNVADKPAAHYSGGLKRRLNLAIGLLGQPQLLYLDEPTVGIDAQSRRFILEKIKSLREQGMTVIYTSHYLEEVEVLCDSVAIIDNGQVIYRQPADEKMSDRKGALEEKFLQLTRIEIRE